MVTDDALRSVIITIMTGYDETRYDRGETTGLYHVIILY